MLGQRPKLPSEILHEANKSLRDGWYKTYDNDTWAKDIKRITQMIAFREFTDARTIINDILKVTANRTRHIFHECTGMIIILDAIDQITHDSE